MVVHWALMLVTRAFFEEGESHCYQTVSKMINKKQARRANLLTLYTSDALHYCNNNDRFLALNQRIQQTSTCNTVRFGISPFRYTMLADMTSIYLLMIDAPHQ